VLGSALDSALGWALGSTALVSGLCTVSRPRLCLRRSRMSSAGLVLVLAPVLARLAYRIVFERLRDSSHIAASPFWKHIPCFLMLRNRPFSFTKIFFDFFRKKKSLFLSRHWPSWLRHRSYVPEIAGSSPACRINDARRRHARVLLMLRFS
jgi:hypothetical protein